MFTPGSIGTLRVSNRFVRSATAEFGANDDGTITDLYFDLYRQLPLGEIGTIIQGHLYVLDEGKAHDKMAGISQTFHIEKLKKLTNLIHNSKFPSKIIAQLNHGGASSVSTKAPSIRDDKKTLKMTNEDIEDIIKGFGSAARRAKDAGYDGIQIHAAHGYLISQFLSKKTNQRSDEWGGSLDNRSKLLLEVYAKIRSIVGSNFPILVKMNGSDDPIEGFPVEEGVRVAKKLADIGLNMLEVSGMKSTRRIEEEENTYYVPNAEKIKKQVGDMPICVVGGFRLFRTIQKYRDSFADFISLCRPFIREPDLVKKFKDGKVKADCISCNKCFKVEDIVRCRDMDKNH